jgi:Bacterial PH domain
MHNEKYADSKLWSNRNFPNKIKDDEDIVFIVRKDLVFLLARVISFFLIFLFILTAKVILAGYLSDVALDAIDSVFYTVNIILLTSFTLYFHNYYLSLQIVTSERIIDIDQQGLFLREVNELPIDNIEDVTYKQNGFWGTVFNFGNVIVQTAGEGIEVDPKTGDKVNGFVFDNVPCPADISHTIGHIRQINKQEQMKDHAVYNAQAMNQHYNK